MTNTRLLKAKILESGLTRDSLAKALGISKASLSYKINNKRQFKAKEIMSLCAILHLEDVSAYFFNS